MKSKVKFGLKNVVYAIEQETDTYGDVKQWPGAVNITRELQGEENAFYADNMVYYSSYNHQGYTGEFESALIPEDVETEVYGDEIDETTGIIKESRASKTKRIALGFQIDGDADNRRHWMYGVTLSRPNTEAGTTTETAEPQTDTVSYTASGLTNSDVVMIKTSSKTPETAYNKFFEKVVMPDQYTELQGE